VFPAVIAPISGSNDTPVLFFVWFHVILLTQTNENSNIAIWIKSGHCFV
jgi:hypothetical protein